MEAPSWAAYRLRTTDNASASSGHASSNRCRTTNVRGWSTPHPALRANGCVGCRRFFWGRCDCPTARRAANVENAWQLSKVHALHADAAGHPTIAYQRWSEAGLADPQPRRYPMGKGARPLYVLCGGERLSYAQARLRLYWPVYRDAVAQSPAFDRLEQTLQAEGRISLFDFDGYDHDAQGRTLAQVIHDPHRRMGHAFVLKAMLLFGRDVEPHDVIDREPAQQSLVAQRAAPGFR